MKKLIYIFVLGFIIIMVSTQSYSKNSDNDNSAVYTGLQEDQYLKKWLILGPFPVMQKDVPFNDEIQKKAFMNDIVSPKELSESAKTGKLNIDNVEWQWKAVDIEDDVVDFLKQYKDTAFQYAYAFAEINMPEDKQLLIGFGSDDAIKVWVNNEPVHENWIARALQRDDDLVPVKLKKGKNEVLVKVQNMEYGWEFCCHIIGQKSFTEKLIDYSRSGNVDAVKLLLANGADVNGRIDPGVTALHSAKIAGRKDIVKLLLDKGADSNIPMPEKEKLIDAYINKFIKDNYPGAAVLIAKDGKILYEKSYGFADVENKIPITTETKFRIGSITKQFVASAILKLQEQGLLNVDDPLSKFIPDFQRGNEVKIHHLLTHTSGIHSYTNKPEFIARVGSSINQDDLINEIKKDAYDFNPGDRWSYNNSGFFILGYIIEKVSGMAYGDFLKKKFFDPLGMNNTGVYKKDLGLTNEAVGYSYENNKVSKALNWDMSWAGGAGSLYSTIEDLYKWNEAIFTGKLLSESSLKATFTPVVTKENSVQQSNSGYGYGWGISERRGFREIGHGGGLHGFNSNLLRFPEQNFTVVVLLNCLPTLPGADASSYSQEVAEIYFWDKMAEQESFAVNKEVSTAFYKDYVGEYEYPGGSILSVTTEDNKIFAQLSGQGKLEIFPKSETEFFWKVVEAQITFIKDESGKVTGAKHQQNGQVFSAPKLVPKTEVNIDPSILELYKGEYDLNGMKVVITKEETHLFAQLTGQPKVELYPESETDFFLKVVVANVKFFFNDSHEVTHLLFKQGGQEIKAAKMK